jgi:undecaprenyl-diphosphatase
VFVALTQLGGIYLVAGVSLAMVVYLVLKKKYYKALFVAVSIGGVALVNVLLKTLFDRSRPDLWQHLVTETSFSFPSGHASASAALAFTVVLLLWNTRWRTLSLSIGALYVVTIGFSRMYLGVHFPSDILGGWLLAVSWVTLMAGILYSYKNRRKGTNQ